jgi:O-methyltransferase
MPPPIVLSIPSDPSTVNAQDLYLDLMKKILTRVLVSRHRERHTIRPWSFRSRLINSLNKSLRRYEIVRLNQPTARDYLESGHEAQNRAEDAESMVGLRQFDHVQRCILDVINQNVAGDLLEAGVWRGGMSIFMRAVLKAYQCTDRKIWVADSFAGLPDVDLTTDRFGWKQGDMAESLENVKHNFARYGLLDDQVEFLKGYFNETMPKARLNKLAILRVDADLYSSTKDVLDALYAKLSIGGYAIFDDYQNLEDCRRAIDEFRSLNNIREKIQPIDERAIFWQRTI